MLPSVLQAICIIIRSLTHVGASAVGFETIRSWIDANNHARLIWTKPGDKAHICGGPGFEDVYSSWTDSSWKFEMSFCRKPYWYQCMAWPQPCFPHHYWCQFALWIRSLSCIQPLMMMGCAFKTDGFTATCHPSMPHFSHEPIFSGRWSLAKSWSIWSEWPIAHPQGPSLRHKVSTAWFK